MTELCTFLQLADRVNIFLGGGQESAHGDIAFRQQGILTRDRIVPLIADKLRAAGKLVVLEQVRVESLGPGLFRVLDCTLGNTRSRGILVKGDDGIIQINPIEYITS